MGNRRPQPKLLSAKLLAIREFLNIGQVDMANKLQFEILSHSRRQYQIQPARISEYEHGEREPNLFVLIAYIRLGQVHMESLVDDDIAGDKFRRLLGKEFCFLTFSPPLKEKSGTSQPLALVEPDETRR